MSLIACAIVHHTGTILRFRTSQLPDLPNADCDMPLVLPNGAVVHVHFRRHPANPNISGPGLVRYIKRRLRFGEKRGGLVELGPGNVWRLFEIGDAEKVASAHGIRLAALRRGELLAESLAEALGRIDRIHGTQERRIAYQRLLRPALLRRLILGLFGESCQVDACKAPEDASAYWNDAAAGRAIVEVHHVESLAACVDHHPHNLCVLCANHHRLIHGFGPWTITHVGDNILIGKGPKQLQIVRDLSFLRATA